MAEHVSRLAPSPTGALHLGNARTFLVNWALARNLGWTLLMRIEDLDGPRVKTGAAEQTLGVLAWLGIDFDGEPVHQSRDLEPYRQAMRTLAGRGRAYVCELSRRQIEAASSAPHDGGHELRYPAELRPPGAGTGGFEREDANYRLIVGDERIVVDDEVAGPAAHCPGEEVGDFVIWTKRGADQAERLAPRDLQVEVVQDLHLAVAGAQRVDDDIRFVARKLGDALLGDVALERLGAARHLLDQDHGVGIDVVIADRALVGGAAVAGLGHHAVSTS